MLKTSDFHFHLPEELIAQTPAAQRSDARMMVLDRSTRSISHDVVSNFSRYLKPDDLVVLNNTKVIAARAFTVDHRLEILLLEKRGPAKWEALVKPGKRARPGMELDFGTVKARVLEILEEGARLLEFSHDFDPDDIGVMPLPPYIRRDYSALAARGNAPSLPAATLPDGDIHELDKVRYQTTFAQMAGSSAAPTAGLHFTPEMLAQFAHVFVTLHVGIGTFRPVKVDTVAEHKMHAESYFIPEPTASRINSAKRVVCVGTTSVRTLESAAVKAEECETPERVETIRNGKEWMVNPTDLSGGKTEIFIYPPYEFKICGALLTNFHLPQSTLLMMISALAGRDYIMHAYEEAVREKYRFFSYGDCMLIL
ncbi:MAG: tRNA preQ1(34) S-adenosylmethionine ribosyltransferase-isomerase QueA [Verrucomicrobiota bacterium]|nr:tRNA preQ1(34) S-adenosylmethionine ribosyltransferase-isomerase QueA [Verrucomicrobiota bacterium]